MWTFGVLEFNLIFLTSLWNCWFCVSFGFWWIDAVPALSGELNGVIGLEFGKWETGVVCSFCSCTPKLHWESIYWIFNFAYSLVRTSSIACRLLVTCCPNVESASTGTLVCFFSLKYSRVDVTTSPATDFKSEEPLLCSFLDFRGLLVDLEYDWSSLFSSSSSTASFSLELYCKSSLLISGSPALSVSWKKIIINFLDLNARMWMESCSRWIWGMLELSKLYWCHWWKTHRDEAPY